MVGALKTSGAWIPLSLAAALLMSSLVVVGMGLVALFSAEQETNYPFHSTELHAARQKCVAEGKTFTEGCFVIGQGVRCTPKCEKLPWDN